MTTLLLLLQLFVTANRVSFPAIAPNVTPGVWVFSTASWTWPMMPLPPQTWLTIDLADGPQWNGWMWQLPLTTVAVELTGILVVTNPAAVPCEVRVTVRPPGSTWHEAGYQMQTGAPAVGGSRSNATVTVAVVDRKFELYWYHNCDPVASSAGLNLMVQKVFWYAPHIYFVP